MDTSGNIDDHSLIKLKLYELYLTRYLSVLLTTAYSFNEIIIHDIFAGSGISDNGEEGSAVIAAKIITLMNEKHPSHQTKICLNVNEKDEGRFKRLDAEMKKFSFARAQNLDANKYIEAINIPPKSHNLFFIDPHGYTQISPENLSKLFSIDKADYLIFIPIFNIYRFLKQEEDSPQYEPIATKGGLINISIN